MEERKKKRKELDLVLHLNLDCFKVYPCNKAEKHNHKRCPFFHGPKDRKRQVRLLSSEMCPGNEADCCIRGEDCHLAHNRVEHLYSAERYKTKFCTTYPDRIYTCEYGDYCSFAHSQDDIRINLIHNHVFDVDFYLFLYKTVFCPFNLTKHDMARCVYAHNWQDYRRPPDKFRYGNKLCPNWKRTSHLVVDYVIDGCVKEFTCEDCHGWKERQYHPLNFRTEKCPNFTHCSKPECTYFHKDERPRLTTLPDCEQFVPRNRLADLPKPREDLAMHSVFVLATNQPSASTQLPRCNSEIEISQKKREEQAEAMLDWLLEDDQ